MHLIKKHIYAILSFFCIPIIIYIQIDQPKKDVSAQDFPFNITPETLLNNPHAGVITIISLLYIILLLAGIIALSLFILKKSKHQELIPQQTQEPFPLPYRKTTQLLFIVLFAMILPYFFKTLLINLSKKTNPLAIPIILNLFLECFVIWLVYSFLRFKKMVLTLSKKEIQITLKTFIALIPLTCIALLINKLIVDSSGIKSQINPAITILFSLKNPFLLTILFFQVIFIGPVAEEFLFRTFLYKALKKKSTFLISGLFTSIIFAFAHGTPQDFLPLLTISMTLCYLYEKTQKVSTIILLHALHNGLNFSLLLIIKNVIVN